MKKFLLAGILTHLSISITIAQSPLPPLDKSPMDESYCPNNYPLLKIQDKETDTWGSFRYDIKNDVARIVAPVEIQTEVAEVFTITFDKSEKGYDLHFYWDNIKITVPITTSL